jgi:hypothetical protein
MLQIRYFILWNDKIKLRIENSMPFCPKYDAFGFIKLQALLRGLFPVKLLNPKIILLTKKIKKGYIKHAVCFKLH